MAKITMSKVSSCYDPPGRPQRGGGGLYVGGVALVASVGTKIGAKIAAGIGAEGFVSLEKEEKK